MNKPTTQLQLLGYLITIVLFIITSYVIITNRVTALETNYSNQRDINNTVEKKLDKIIDLLIDNKQSKNEK